ncbi:MAG: FecR family protein [Parabacteroides sp.]|nr:FecR family protein [Parabacteroides sp.]
MSLKKGEKKTIQLTDGTKVVLNSDTRLHIPSNFNKEERVIEMEGEGFFDVTPNPDKPFIIKSGETQVRVLGTSFDFKSYKEDEFIKLTVSTGKVRINVADQDLQLSVSPNEHLSINKVDGNVRKETIRENNYIKWMQGSLYLIRSRYGKFSKRSTAPITGRLFYNAGSAITL